MGEYRKTALVDAAPPVDGGGWVYFNPDTGTEYAPNHPVESGECGDATDIRRSTGMEDAMHARIQGYFQASLPSAPKPVATEAVERAREAVGYTKMGSGGRADFKQLREAVAEANCGHRIDHGLPESLYPGHAMVEGINYNSLDRIVTAFVDHALAATQLPESDVAGVSDTIYEAAVQGRRDFRQAYRELLPLQRAAQALSDHWRTNGARVDTNEFFALIDAIDVAVTGGGPTTPERRAEIVSRAAPSESDVKAGAGERFAIVTYLRELSGLARAHHAEVCLREDDEILGAIVTRMETFAFAADQIEKGVHAPAALSTPPAEPVGDWVLLERAASLLQALGQKGKLLDDLHAALAAPPPASAVEGEGDA